MLLSRSCEYALRTALHLASREAAGFVSVRTVSREVGIPYPFLAKVVQALTSAGVFASRRGRGGGIMLAHAPAAIPLEAIVRAVDGPDAFHACVLGLPGCDDRHPCPLHARWNPARSAFRAMFETTTLGELSAHVAQGEYRLAPGVDRAWVPQPGRRSPVLSDSPTPREVSP